MCKNNFGFYTSQNMSPCLRILLTALIGSILYGEGGQLKISEIRPVMDEMLAVHIEHREMAPLLMRRAFKLFIEQFDMARMYLLQDEVRPFLEKSDKELARSVLNYRGGDLTDFICLSQVIQEAVFRARSFRREIQKELILNGEGLELPSGESYLGFAKSDEQLKMRIRTQLVRFLLEEKRLAHLEEWTPEIRAKIFQLLSRRVAQKEESYLILDESGKFLDKTKSEHYLSLHALKSLAKSLDAHSCYFSREEAVEMRTALEKQFDGIGVVLREALDGVVISDLVKGGPADKSGQIAVGDQLVEVDGKSLQGLSYEQILRLLKGDGKRELVLKVKRLGSSSPIHVSLNREKIVMQDERLQTEFHPYADGIIGKLVLPSFYEGGHQSSAEQDIREGIKKLKKQGNLKGLILDMRENSGGFLTQAVKVASLFITRGVVVISKYAQGEMKYLREVDGRNYFDGPLVVLTSKASASAAEIVAQALQDYGAAVIVGDERTYGKGTIQYQTVTDENAKSYYKVTVGRYYTVSGRTTQIEGVKADLVVPTEYAPYNIGERYLEYPLANDRVAPAYSDPLTDVEEKTKIWMQKNYLPHLQKPQTHWQKLLPVLSKNSSLRQKKDKNFSLFVQSQEKIQGLSPRSFHHVENPSWGRNDLQMDEAVNILKDMIEIRTTPCK